VHGLTGENENQRGATKYANATVVPDKDISKCSLVHLSRSTALTETNQRVIGSYLDLGFQRRQSRKSQQT